MFVEKGLAKLMTWLGSLTVPEVRKQFSVMDTRLVGIALYYPWPGSILG